jgi:putative tryptophan/tyrosine transport system substrate-binding protein
VKARLIRVARDLAVVVVALAVGAGVDAQPATQVPRVGVLNPGSSTESPAVQREPFERGLRELGWTPGSNIHIDYRFAEGRSARLEDLAAELVQSKVDVIVARSLPAVGAARRATTSIPIVMSSAADPVASGHIKSLARPGGNVTGIANLTWELESKRLELLKSAIPGLTRVGVLENLSRRPPPAATVALSAAARTLGLEIQTFTVNKLEELAETFAAMSRARLGAILLRADVLVLEPNRTQVAALAARHRLPAIYPWRFYVDVGGLMSYAESIPAFHHRSATYVDRILKGAKPADLPVEQPSKFELVVNLKTARALELLLPHGFLLRADDVIE